MARLSTTDCKRLENAIVGAHILAGVQEAKNMDVYGNRISRVGRPNAS